MNVLLKAAPVSFFLMSSDEGFACSGCLQTCHFVLLCQGFCSSRKYTAACLGDTSSAYVSDSDKESEGVIESFWLSPIGSPAKEKK